MAANDGAESTKKIDTTSNRSKVMSHSQTHIEEAEDGGEDSYLSGSEHDVYGGEIEEEEEEEQDARDFDLTGQLGNTPGVPDHLQPLILSSD